MAHLKFWALVPLLVACGPPSLPPVRAANGDQQLVDAQGRVLGVDERPAARELDEGITLRLQASGDEPIVLQLAPRWYLDERGIRYATSESLTVRGRQRSTQAGSVIVVTDVRKGDRWIPLRDPSGSPLWPQSDSPAEP